MSGLFDYHNEIFRGFAFYSGIVVVKMVFMSPLTGINRVIRKALANREDAALFKTKVQTNETVERIRRAHMNDIENIVPFFCLGLLYMTTRPSPAVALNCFRIFAAARIGHSVSYLSSLFVPRFLCFAAGISINIFMGINVILSFM